MANKIGKKKRVILTEALFNKVQVLLQAGVKPSKVGAVMELSYGTIYRVQQAGTWDNYKSYQAKAKAKRQAAPAQLHFTNEDMPQADGPDTIGQLKRVADSLERIATAIEAGQYFNNTHKPAGVDARGIEIDSPKKRLFR